MNADGARTPQSGPLSTVIPRWEWRVFGDRFPLAEADFTARTPTGVQDSDELYLLTASGDNVKVRDELLDIKVLQEVDRDGLQRWSPVLKARFPLTLADAATALRSLGISGRAPDAPITLDALLEAVTPHGAVRVVRVRKHRVRYSVGGCLAEVAAIEVDGRRGRTVAVEGEDPGAVLTTVRSMGLGGYRNTSYPEGLTAILDGTTERAAVIDVGTNSVKLCVGEPTAGGWRYLADRAVVTRLGEGLAADGSIADAAVDRTSDAIGAMVAEARDLDAAAIVALGTAGLRTAANSASVISRICSRTGIQIEVVSGEEESRLAFLAVGPDVAIREGGLVVVFDTGGGSTQFTFGHAGRVDESFSLPVGAVRFTERFGLHQAVSAAQLRDAMAAIRIELAPVGDRPHPDALVGIGGAVTNLVAVQLGLERYDPDRVRGWRLEAAELDRQIEAYRKQDARERQATVGLQPGRADVILAGACIVRVVMDVLGASSLVVSDRGLRHGALIDRFGATPPGSSVAGGQEGTP